MSVERLRTGTNQGDRFRPSRLVPRAIIIFFVAILLATGSVGLAQDVPVRLSDVMDNGPIAQFASRQPAANQFTTQQFTANQFTAQQQHQPPVTETVYCDNETCDPWHWQVLPEGLIYRSYLAGSKEPRIGCQWVYDYKKRWIWDITFGGRVGIARYGDEDALHPQGWQIDLEAAAFPRLDMQKHPNAPHTNDLVACDYRAGLPVTYGFGRWQMKMGYYHISSHLGDELMIRDPNYRRINYSRDSAMLGQSYYWTDDLRIYGEVAYAVSPSGGALPWEFQFGMDYSPAEPSGFRPQPFAAINAHLREDVNFGGSVIVQVGIQWRGVTGHLFRMGMHYFNGMSNQYEFYDQYESKLGFGVWYDY